MKKILLTTLISVFSLNSFALDRCSEYTDEYRKVLSDRSFNQNFMNVFHQSLIFSQKELEFDLMSSDEQLKAMTRVYTYCTIQIGAGIDLKLSLAMNSSI
ncbi:hypothetical protein DFP75_101458 [Marinomonas alcarazii]|uniref:Uncharacterized protein n=1 Tax=Marinomonas alcarazii TaxID=491949 RepID=A0A318V8P3_9GAMM|nr:hypothetical protein [Marinomonas alcarazii]PYF84433.1 hypothetical protein DFP75_101458 [Marinomonas alcarazii]